MAKKKFSLLYVPALHKGVLNFVEASGQTILVLNEEVIHLIDAEFDYLRKEIRSLTPTEARKALQALFPKKIIELLTKEKLAKLNTSESELLLPDEDIFHWLAKEHLSKADCTFSPTFLRWNRNNTLKKHPVSAEMARAFAVANQSSDWWRQVGCALVVDGKVLSVAHNAHLPSPYTPYIDSDPRNSFHKGEHIEMTTAIHAEAALIADAARKGISLDGAELYVTTFPCPTCAKLVAASGIAKLYFTEGYSMLDGEQVLTQANVEIIELKK